MASGMNSHLSSPVGVDKGTAPGTEEVHSIVGNQGELVLADMQENGTILWTCSLPLASCQFIILNHILSV